MGSHPLFTFLFEGFNAFRCDAVVPTSSFSFWLVPIVLYPSIGLHAMHDDGFEARLMSKLACAFEDLIMDSGKKAIYLFALPKI